MQNKTPQFLSTLLLAVIAGAAWLPTLAVADSCVVASTTISGAVTDNCQLDNESVSITSAGSISVTGFNVGVFSQTGSNTIANSGSIISTGYYSVRNISTLTSLTNSGTITSSAVTNAVGILNSGTITTLTNNSTISATTTGGASSAYGIWNAGGTITTLTNNGTISATGPTAAGINNGATITTLINNGTISSITNTGTINTLTNSGTISSALTMGAGTLNLDGTASLITGAVTGTGAVNVNGSFTTESTFNVGSMSITSGGVFTQSHGVTTATGFANAGTLAIQAGTTSTITGDYNQAAGGTFRSKVTNDTTYGKLAVTGTATLPSNANIDVNVENPNFSFTVTSMANIISAGTLTSDGTFSVTDNSLLFNFSAVKDGNTVDLSIAAAAPAVGASVTNQGNTPATGAASVLDSVIASNPTGDLASLFVSLTTSQQVSNAVSQTLPLMTGGMAQVSGSILHSINRVVQTRHEVHRGLSSGDEFLGNRKFWLKPFGSRAQQNDVKAVAGYKSNTGGFALGFDGEISRSHRLGLGFAYGSTSVNGNSQVARQNARVDTYQAIVYGSYSLDEATEVNYQLDGGANRTQGTRQIAFANRTANATYNSATAHVGVGIGRVMPLSADTTFTPSLHADYTWMRDMAYTESGAGALNLNVRQRDVGEFILGGDGKLATKVSDSTTLTANFGAGYDAMSKRSSILASFVGGGAAFNTTGFTPSKWLYRAGAGMVVAQASGAEITARYDIEHRDGFDNQTVSAKFRWAF